MINKIKRWFNSLFINKKKIAHNQKICRAIGEFYVRKHDALGYKESVVKAQSDIIEMCITKIDSDGNKIIITLSRPGILIGRHGTNITELQNYLSKELEYTVHIHIIEDVITQHLIPYYYDDDYDDLD